MDVDRAAALYRSGMSVRQVAAELDASVSSVDTQLRKAGVTMRPAVRPRMAVDDDRIIQLRNDGLTWPQIAASVGMTPSGVASRYRRAMALSKPAG